MSTEVMQEAPSENGAPERSEMQPNPPEKGESKAARKEDAAAKAERKRIEEQLAMLEKKQAELRRALAIADHPELGEAIREIEGRIYRASKAQTKLENPLTKSEVRQRDKLAKKLETARAKRAELDQTIASLETELNALGEGRIEGLKAEHDAAVRALFATLARYAEAFESAGLQAANLIPELKAWLPTLRALAEAQGVDPKELSNSDDEHESEAAEA